MSNQVLSQILNQLQQMDKRFDNMDGRLNRMNGELDDMEEHTQNIPLLQQAVLETLEVTKRLEASQSRLNVT